MLGLRCGWGFDNYIRVNMCMDLIGVVEKCLWSMFLGLKKLKFHLLGQNFKDKILGSKFSLDFRLKMFRSFGQTFHAAHDC